jgi:hypothetical protein
MPHLFGRQHREQGQAGMTRCGFKIQRPTGLAMQDELWQICMNQPASEKCKR